MEKDFRAKKGKTFKLAGLVASLLLVDAIHVAHAAAFPASVLPEQVTRSLIEQQPAPARATPQPIAEPKQPEEKAASEAAKKIKFRLNGITLKGNKIFSTKILEQFYKKYLHKEITVADLFTSVQEMTNYYRNNGYILSRAILPPQHVKGGVVEIEVIEGFINEVRVTGMPYGAKCLVQAIGSQVTKNPPLQLPSLEYAITIANEVPGTQVKAVMSPSKTNPGAADLLLDTTISRVTGYFSYDNYGTRYIGPQQMTANLGANSLLTSGDSIQFTMTKTPKGGEMTFNDVNYSYALDPKGKRMTIGSTRSKTHPLFVLQSAQIDGSSNNYYANSLFPILRERTRTMNLTAAFNWMDSSTTSFDTELYADHVRSLDFGANFSNADRWYGSNSLAANFRQGLPMFGYSSDTDVQTAETSRPGGRADYTKITASASRLQAITGPVSFYSLFRGQWAFNPLLSSEQFSVGGSSIGRGYDSAEIIGDKGISGTFELRYDLAVGKVLQSMQLYAFYDYGIIWNIITSTGSPAKNSLTSAGFGSRFYFTKYISGNLMWTQNLTKEVAAEELIGRGNIPRAWFSIVAAFM